MSKPSAALAAAVIREWKAAPPEMRAQYENDWLRFYDAKAKVFDLNMVRPFKSIPSNVIRFRNREVNNEHI